MRVLNLSTGFTPFNHLEAISFETFVFNGGEPHIKLNMEEIPTYCDEEDHDPDVLITTRLSGADEVMLLLAAVDALNRTGAFDHMELFISYFPGARQDRVMVPGEPLTAKMYADFINNLNMDWVMIFDPHSDVTPALVKNCEVFDNHLFVESAINEIISTPYEFFYLVSPDAGANKKVLSLAMYLRDRGYNLEVLKCDKTRDVSTGAITNFDVYGETLGGARCIIVDDIIDGGGTFLGLGDSLMEKEAGNLHLVVSHGIFSKGFRDLNKVFESIYTTNSFPNIDNAFFRQRWDNTFYRVHQIKLEDVLHN